MISVVAIGGGTGTSCVISALKRIQQVRPSAVVGMADSGGSTGRLRDEFGFPPVGDVRQSLAALAEEDSQRLIRDVLLYRFEKGSSLRGHSLGNLLLTALQDMTGGTGAALSAAETIFRLRGKVFPATEDNIQLEIEYVDGSRITGEHKLDDLETGNKPIKAMHLLPQARIYPPAMNAIVQADYIIIGPGDYYASILSALLVDGMAEALRNTSARIVLIMNLMSRYTQTDGWPASAYVKGIEGVIGRSIDAIVLHEGKIPATLVESYAKAREFPVKDDLQKDSRTFRDDLMEDVQFVQSQADAVKRSVLRHSSRKLSTILESVFYATSHKK